MSGIRIILYRFISATLAFDNFRYSKFDLHLLRMIYLRITVSSFGIARLH